MISKLSIARHLGRLVALAALVASGTYVLVYLYRWEWNRALVAGVFFLAAELAIIASGIMRRLKALEDRIDTIQPPTPTERLHQTAPEPRSPFAWLEPEHDRFSVFVPVLLGAGVILSLVAAGVERLAAATAGPSLERRLGRRLDAIALPAAGFLGPPPAPPLPVPLGRRVVTAALSILAIAAAWGAVDALGDLTQDRPDPVVEGRRSTLVLDISHRFNPRRSPMLAAEALFLSCRHTIGDRTTHLLTALPDRQVRLELDPGFGEHAGKKLMGCLSDARIDRMQARVVSVEHSR